MVIMPHYPFIKSVFDIFFVYSNLIFYDEVYLFNDL